MLVLLRQANDPSLSLADRRVGTHNLFLSVRHLQSLSPTRHGEKEPSLSSMGCVRRIRGAALVLFGVAKWLDADIRTPQYFLQLACALLSFLLFGSCVGYFFSVLLRMWHWHNQPTQLEPLQIISPPCRTMVLEVPRQITGRVPFPTSSAEAQPGSETARNSLSGLFCRELLCYEDLQCTPSCKLRNIELASKIWVGVADRSRR